MTPGLVQRHQDYVLGPNQDARLASVAAGAVIQGVSLQLDPDAPFLLRSRAMRVQYSATRTQTGLAQLCMRYSGPNRIFRSQDFVRQSLLSPYFGQLGNPIPVYPQILYPRSGAITADIFNNGTSALTNLTLYFRGVKLFAPGAVRAYTYPSTFGGLPYVYAQGTKVASDDYRLIRNVLVTQNSLRVTFTVKGDADFVIRGGQAGLPFSTTPVNEVFLKLRDEDEKPYSNDFVHMDVLFGNSGFGATYVAGGGNIAPIAGGPNTMGLFYPEIYVPMNHLMYLDVQRADVSFSGAVPVDLPVSFIGQKVFPK